MIFNNYALSILMQRFQPQEIEQIWGYIHMHEPVMRQFQVGMYLKPSQTGLARAIQIAPQCQKILIHFNRKKQGDVALGISEYKVVTLALELRTGWWYASGGERRRYCDVTDVTNEIFFLQALKGSRCVPELESVICYCGIFKYKLIEPCTYLKRRLTVEYGDLGDLQYALNKRRLTVAQKKIVFEDLIQRVAYLHRNGMIHRDLKVENILLSSQDPRGLKAIVADLGTMKTAFQEVQTKKRAYLNGTDWYWPPEYAALVYKALRGTKPDPQELAQVDTANRDSWSLGITLLQLLDETFEFRWHDPNVLNVAKALANLREDWLGECSDKNSPLQLVREMLRVDPAKRLTAEAAEQRLRYLNWT